MGLILSSAPIPTFPRSRGKEKGAAARACKENRRAPWDTPSWCCVRAFRATLAYLPAAAGLAGAAAGFAGSAAGLGFFTNSSSQASVSASMCRMDSRAR